MNANRLCVAVEVRSDLYGHSTAMLVAITPRECCVEMSYLPPPGALVTVRFVNGRIVFDLPAVVARAKANGGRDCDWLRLVWLRFGDHDQVLAANVS
jgi:hypothetical protein